MGLGLDLFQLFCNHLILIKHKYFIVKENYIGLKSTKLQIQKILKYLKFQAKVL